MAFGVSESQGGGETFIGPGANGLVVFIFMQKAESAGVGSGWSASMKEAEGG